MKTFPTLYKRDTKGKVRVWYQEVEGNKYRTVSGLQDGKRVTTEWTVVEGKNIGRSNETTPEQQAIAEVEAEYKKRQEKEYYADINQIDDERFFEPMLAKKWEDNKLPLDFNAGIFVQPKLDGIRCIANKDGLWSRKGKPITACPHIFESLRHIFIEFPDAILDGELYNHDLKDDFNTIVSAVKRTKPKPQDFVISAKLVQYHVYDIGTTETFEDRTFKLKAICNISKGIWKGESEWPVQLVDTYKVNSVEEIDDLNAEFIAAGYEGQMIRFNVVYDCPTLGGSRRSKFLLKRKEFQDAEYEIVRIEAGLGNWSGYAKRVVCKLPDGREFGSGIKGNQEHTRKLLAEADEYVGKQVTVRYFAETPDGIPRFPVAYTFHKTERW